MKILKDKVALITGAASGIGRASALLFAQEGAAVAIIDLDEGAGQAAVAEIESLGGKAIFIQGNVTSAGDCQVAVGKTLATYGGVDILFNNAGIIRRTNILNTREEDWDLVMAVNVKSIFLMSKYTIPHMIAAGGGVIINTSSGWGLKGGANAVSYCASKGAVTNMTRAMAIDLGQYNIRVNALCPGDTDTPMLRNEAQQLGESEDAFLADAADRPLMRFAQPLEIARAALFLASEGASYVSGTALVVDGGGLA
jgi:NAD(P)-dependent dehydrogenase (short-subunit alcohol dehydrogenase family)